MNKRLFWKLCLIIGTGVVALFYVINMATSQIENDMSMLNEADIEELEAWSDEAESLLLQGQRAALEEWLEELQHKENTWAAVASANVQHIAGNHSRFDDYTGYNMGRSTEWKIHLYFEENPIMELPFSEGNTSLLVALPPRMRPGSYWTITRITLQVLLPMGVLILLSTVLYHHIMNPLRELDAATQAFSNGNYLVRVKEQLGSRDDELAHLSQTFDSMADHIGDLIMRQRQLITDLSHELRTPLTRLDIATETLLTTDKADAQTLQRNLSRVHRESANIRKLVDDTLTLSWLENEQPDLRNESVDIAELIGIIVEDARFEYPDRTLVVNMPGSAIIENTNHRALGQAIENILRNALRYTPAGLDVIVDLIASECGYEIHVSDKGPGVPDQHLRAIFRPFYRVEKSRPTDGSSFGLGLALAQRQLKAICASIKADNLAQGGLKVSIQLPHR